jgi:hypothetical protein
LPWTAGITEVDLDVGGQRKAFVVGHTEGLAMMQAL